MKRRTLSTLVLSLVLFAANTLSLAAGQDVLPASEAVSISTQKPAEDCHPKTKSKNHACDIPEVPWAAALPTLAIAAGAGYYVLSQRRNGGAEPDSSV